METLNYIELDKFQSGYYEAGPSYKYFIPYSVNKNWVWQSNEINKLASIHCIFYIVRQSIIF